MTTTNNEHNRPSHIIWQVIDTNNKPRWNRIGAGWPNSDGKGLTLKFDSFPLDGRVVVREHEQKDDDQK